MTWEIHCNECDMWTDYEHLEATDGECKGCNAKKFERCENNSGKLLLADYSARIRNGANEIGIGGTSISLKAEKLIR